MRQALTAILLMTVTSSVLAGDFDPEKYGLLAPRQGIVGTPALDCHDIRTAEDGRNKVWSCSDGRQFFGPEDVWSRPSTLPERSATKPFDAVVRLPAGKSMLTIRQWVNNRYCGSGKTKSCSGREVVSVSHMIVDRNQCDVLGEQLAYDDYVNSGRPDNRIKISWDCR
jgi:hypothetical protein